MIQIIIDPVNPLSFSEFQGLHLEPQKRLNVRLDCFVQILVHQGREEHRRRRLFRKNPPAGKQGARDVEVFLQPNCFTLQVFPIKNAPNITDRFILDAAFQAYLIRQTGLPLGRVYIIYHGDEPYEMEEVTLTVERYASTVEENFDRLRRVKDQPEESALHGITAPLVPRPLLSALKWRNCGRG